MNSSSVADEPLRHYSYWRVFFMIVAVLAFVLSIGLPVTGYKLIHKFNQILIKQVLHDNKAIADFFSQHIKELRDFYQTEEEWLQAVRDFVNDYQVPNHGFVCLIDQQSNLQAYPGLTERRTASFFLNPYDPENQRFKTDMPVTIPDLFQPENESGVSGEIVKAEGADWVVFQKIVIRDTQWLVGIHQGKMGVEQSIRDMLPFIVGLGAVLFLAIVIPFGIFTGFLIRQHELVRNEHIYQIEKHSQEIEHFAFQLQETNNRLNEMQTEKSRLYARLSHDLRAPLSSVVSACTLVAEGAYGETTEKQRTAMTRVERNVDVLLNLIDNMLQLSRFESGHVSVSPSTFSLPDLLNEISENLSPSAETKQLSIQTQTGDGITTIETDREKLYLILQNLVNNAIKYTEQGKIIISAAKQEQDIVQIQVIDTGKGIRQEEQEVIFQEFSRGEEGQNGHEAGGLGLAITKELTDLLGGSIQVQSKEGEGSTFSVTIPLSNNAITTASI